MLTFSKMIYQLDCPVLKHMKNRSMCFLCFHGSKISSHTERKDCVYNIKRPMNPSTVFCGYSQSNELSIYRFLNEEMWQHKTSIQ